MKIATLFSGIGSPEQGATRVYKNVQTIFACEYDKFARQSYSAIYDIEPKHFHKDVNDLDATQYKNKVDILIGGSPCQAFSIAGMRHGTEDERGQLIYQYIRVVEECNPPIIVYENVKGMMSIDNGNTIKEFVQALRDIGYHCHYGVVNTKDYGVPQNRERLFCVGFKDVDVYHSFSFGYKQPLAKRLKDVLEDDVDEKYYLSDKAVSFFKQNSINNEAKGNGFRFRPTDGSKCSKAITTLAGNRMDDNFIYLVEPLVFEDRTDGTRFFADDCCGTLRTIDACGDKRVANKNGIRKLTPLECWRLQDFPDEAHNKAKEAGLSNSQLYKQAGNSMSVNILEMIFNQIEKAKKNESNTLF